MILKQYNAAYELLEKNSHNIPNKIAFEDDVEKISFLELKIKVQNFSFSLLKSGLARNDKIILCMYDTVDFPICFLGSIWAGIIPICVNTMLQKNDLKYMLDDSNAKAVICSNELLKIFSEIKKENNKNFFIYSNFNDGDHKEVKNFFNIKEMFSKKESNHPPAQTNKNSPCFWLYSSGSTGKPKGTIHLHQSLINTAQLYAVNILKIKESDVFYSAAKLFFAYGLGNSLTFPLYAGGTSILVKDRPTPELVANVIKDKSVTLFFGVPTLYAAMLNNNLNVKNFETVRLSVSAGEALPEHLCKKWHDVIGSKVLDGIGSTEMLHIFISNKIDDLHPGSSGKPVPGYTARLIKDNNTEAIPGEIGELEIKGPTSAKEYWNKPTKTNLTFKGEWTRTGDKYIKNNDNVYTYCGRTDDMMKVSGQYVSPFEIEAALQSHPSVLEVAVVGKLNKDNLLKPKAYIVLNTNLKDSKKLEKELTMHVKNILTPFKYPRWYEFVLSLPKTATGKIQRYKLRD